MLLYLFDILHTHLAICGAGWLAERLQQVCSISPRIHSRFKAQYSEECSEVHRTPSSAFVSCLSFAFLSILTDQVIQMGGGGGPEHAVHDMC